MFVIKTSIHNAEHYIWGDLCDGWHLVKNQGLSVIQERMPAGAREVKHYHEKSRQFFFVLKGMATMEMDGQEIILGTHEGMEVPPFMPHQMFNKSNDDVEFLVISQPESHGDRKRCE